VPHRDVLYTRGVSRTQTEMTLTNHACSLCGGTSGTTGTGRTLDDVYVLDLTTLEWTLLAPHTTTAAAAPARIGHALAAANDKLYTVGGRDGNSLQAVTAVHALNVPRRVGERHRRYLLDKAQGDVRAEEALRKEEKVCLVRCRVALGRSVRVSVCVSVDSRVKERQCERNGRSACRWMKRV
jgi:hypothetical protein